MATSNIVPTEEKANCLRLLSLVIDGGREILFHQFGQRRDADLASKLNRPDIRKKLENVFNKKERNSVYRQLGQPDYSQFDVTLLTTLLRYVCGLDENSPVWRSKPSPTDLSVEADIARLKTIRNKMSHMKNLTLSKTEFETYWDKAEQVILRLGHDIPDLKERIDKLKHETIDPSKEREYQAKLKEYEEMERSLKLNVEEVKDALAYVDKRLENVETEIQSDRQFSVVVQSQVEMHNESLKELQIKHETHEEKFNELDKQERNQAEQLKDVTSKQSLLKHSLEQTTEYCKSNITIIYNRLQNTDANVDKIQENVAKNLEQISSKQTHLQQLMEDTKQKCENNNTSVVSRLQCNEANIDELKETIWEHVKQDSGEVACLKSRTRLHVDDEERQNVFISTNAHMKAKHILENSGWVILTGQPGEGKTTIALELLREMQPTRACVKLNKPKDWENIDLDRDKVDLIFIDDIFGGGVFDDQLLAKWSFHLPDINKAVKKKRVNIIITTRHYILEEARSKMQRQHIFRDENIVSISSCDLSEEEMTLMLQNHFRHAEREITPGLITDCVYEYGRSFRNLYIERDSDNGELLENVSSKRFHIENTEKWHFHEFKVMIGFPEIVSLFSRNDQLFNVGSSFFCKPLIFFKTCMEDLYLDKDKFLALLLVWTRPNQELELNDLESPDPSDELKDTAKKLGIKLKDSTVKSLQSSLEYHNGGFLLFDSERGMFRFCHNIVKDMVGLVGVKQYPAVLEYASLEFLIQYVSVDKQKSQDDLHIFVEKFRYKNLITALWNMIRSPKVISLFELKFDIGLLQTCSFSDIKLKLSEDFLQIPSILKHNCFENDSFVREFIQHDNENFLLSRSVGTFGNDFGYGISLQENIPVYMPSVALLYGKPILLHLCLERDEKRDQAFKDKNFLHTNTLLAINMQSLRTVDLLFLHGSVVNEDAIYLAARKGNATILEFLLEKREKNNDFLSNILNGNSPLIAATKMGSVECVIALLRNGRDVNYKNEKGWTALDKAVWYRRIDVCRLLLEHGASVNNKSGKFKRTPLHRSAELGEKEIANILLQYNASVNVRDSKGHLPIHCAAFSGQHDIVDMLLKAQPESNQLKYRISYGKKSKLSGADLFHVAVWRNNPRVIEVLFQNKVNPNVRDFYGRTPFYRAAYEGKLESIKAFISHFDQNNAYNSHEPIPDINIAENHGFTPLHAAIHMGRTEIAKLICPYANVNAQDKLGKTPLHSACEKLNLDMFKVLTVDYHADFRMITNKGMSVCDIWLKHYEGQEIFEYLAESCDNFKYLKPPSFKEFFAVLKGLDEEFARNWDIVLNESNTETTTLTEDD